MNSYQRRAQISVLVTLVVALVLLALAGRYLVSKHLWATGQLADVEPRYARLLGLRDAGEQLAQNLKESRAALVRLGYPAERDKAQVGNDLQQIARSGLQGAGLTVTTSQVLEARDDGGIGRVGVAVQAEGPLSRLQVALAALQAQTPTLTIDGLVVQPTGRFADDGSPMVACRVTVTVIRLQS